VRASWLFDVNAGVRFAEQLGEQLGKPAIRFALDCEGRCLHQYRVL
jgi:hypothetical protein